jgi:Holliday junction resolvase RusA-like endonuclease
MRITIDLPPITKKNSQQIVRAKGHYMVLPSKQYRKYEKEASKILKWKDEPIDYPVNVECKFYMPTRRRVDIANLTSAIHDVLVHAGVLEDDNRNIVYSMDGSRVLYDKEHPRTEITITRVEDFESWKKRKEV